ncbi:MAG: DNA topoisomerase IB [Sphingomonadaceae bacterium]|nr:DNA topoisomerase IB [Sphingomonadaceae bacterium]
MPRLAYVDDSLPGISRRKRGRYWQYFDAKGERIADREEIDRLNRLAVPPAYSDVWLCPSPHGHIQATGYDDRGRKQYRYHADFRAAQDAAKYERCVDFGRALPLIRARVECDLASRAPTREAVLAAIVRLLDAGHVRIGNREYAEANKSFGATTLRDRHARFAGSRLMLEYKAKSGKMRRLTINDRSLARMVKRCQDLPGQQLFQYLDADGVRRAVGSAEVNDYIREAMGGDFTAKHFRTWGASVIAFIALADAGDAPLSLAALLEPVAEALGNTPAIARKSYVHPALLELCKAGARAQFGGLTLPRATKYLSRHERGLIAFLDQLAERAGASARAA